VRGHTKGKSGAGVAKLVCYSLGGVKRVQWGDHAAGGRNAEEHDRKFGQIR
jgi:hypothetical protein